MLRIPKRQWVQLQRSQRRSFIDAQPARLRERFPDAFARAFPGSSGAAAFVEELVAEAAAAGIHDRVNVEALLDTCVALGWTSAQARATAGVRSVLESAAASPTEKVTLIVNAAAHISAARVGRR